MSNRMMQPFTWIITELINKLSYCAVHVCVLIDMQCMTPPWAVFINVRYFTFRAYNVHLYYEVISDVYSGTPLNWTPLGPIKVS